ncbi:MAG: chorismate mutase [Oscillospiraceae bacterium]
MPTLEEIRQKIDAIDREMAALFEQRMAIAADVASYKKQNSLPVLDAGREKAVVQKNLAFLQNAALAPYYTDFICQVMTSSRQYQTQLLGQNTVAYQGAEGGFGHQVALALYPNAEFAAEATFGSVFDAVEEGRAAFGIVPFENSTTGDVSGVLDLCYSHRCYVAAMYDLPVTQNLLGLPGSDLTGVKTVVSHVQALEQCQRFLANLGAAQLPFANTALAAKYVAETGDASVAAIASLDACERYGLVPLVKDIATEAGNTTRFIVISREAPRGEGSKFSLLFTVENLVGRLARVIAAIAAEGFDMESIKSRPMPQNPWQYYFYTELVGAPSSQQAEALLAKLREVCLSVRILGVYNRIAPATSQM